MIKLPLLDGDIEILVPLAVVEGLIDEGLGRAQAIAAEPNSISM